MMVELRGLAHSDIDRIIDAEMKRAANVSVWRKGGHEDVDRIIDALPDLIALAATTGQPGNRTIEAVYMGGEDGEEYVPGPHRQLEGTGPDEVTHAAPARPTIFDLVDPDSIHGKGHHVDPTGNAACRHNPARDLIHRTRRTLDAVHRLAEAASTGNATSRDIQKTLTDLHRLAVATSTIAGDPICPRCVKPITAGQDTKRTDALEHRGCQSLLRMLPAANEMAQTDCPECRRPLGDAKIKRLHGVPHHEERCWRRAYQRQYRLAA